MHDVRYALRTFARRPSFAIAAVTILALGIAVNTIAFSLVNSLALRPLPVPDAGRVVRVYPLDERGRRGNLFSSRRPASPVPNRSDRSIPSRRCAPDYQIVRAGYWVILGSGVTIVRPWTIA